MGTTLFLLAGLFALGVGGWQGWRTARFLQRAVAVTGHVVAAPGQEGAMSGAHPLVAFATPNGMVVRFRQNGMGARPLGNPLPLRYDPADPAGTAVAAGFWTTWVPVLASLALGLALLAVPLLGVEVGLRGARP